MGWQFLKGEIQRLIFGQQSTYLLKENCCILWIDLAPNRQKLGIIWERKKCAKNWSCYHKVSKTNNNVLMNYMFHWKSFSKIFIFLSLFLSNFYQFLSKSPTDNSHKSRRKFIKTNRYWFLVNKRTIILEIFCEKHRGKSLLCSHASKRDAF